mgnify:FL=1
MWQCFGKLLNAAGITLLLWLAGLSVAYARPLKTGCGPLPTSSGHLLGMASSGSFCADAIRLHDTYGTALFRIYAGNEKVLETKEAIPCDPCVLHRGEPFQGISWGEGRVTLYIQHGKKVIRLETLTFGQIQGQWKPLFWDRSIYEPKTTGEWFEEVDLQTDLAHVQYPRESFLL